MTPFDTAVEAVRADDLTPEQAAADVYALLTDDERLGLLDGDTPFWQGLGMIRAEGYNSRPYVHGAVDRLGIPGIRFADGPRGCVPGRGTAFPVSTARGATWDIALEERVGEVIGREVRAQGANFYGGVCVNLPRHPAWGRFQETYGDDPYHLGEFGAALTRGTQKYVMACVKHYALNSMENARFTVDVTVAEDVLHDVYLPHFKRVVDEGVTGVMTSYNSVNGEWAGQHPYLLTEVLREQWGFRGITVSDFVWGFRDPAKSLQAGLDLEEPFAQQRTTHLRERLDAGATSWAAVERSGLRLLAAQLRSYASRSDGDFGPETMATAEARALARTVAARAVVLLKNEPVQGTPVLPLDPAQVTSIAVIGRLANTPNMGDHGSSDVHPPSHVTPLEGIRAAFPGAEITLVEDDGPLRAAEAARSAQVALVVAGYTAADEGEYVGRDATARPELLALFPPAPPQVLEAMKAGAATSEHTEAITANGGDRTSLTLRPIDEEIIRAVAAANPRTVVCVVAAGTVLTESWRHHVPAILLTWYPGMEGGHALADVLTGAHNPSGRLPFAIPTSAEHLPPYDRDATAITYGRLHGQRLLDDLGAQPAYPHGYGLSYTTYTIDKATTASVEDIGARLTVRVTNTGGRDGRHVVQVHGRHPHGPHPDERPLIGFATVEVPARASAVVEVETSFLPLAHWDPAARLRIPPTAEEIVLTVGSYANDPDAVVLRLNG
ncbi:glycoside hydrolase family 3 protein [Streptomyces sp. T028]|uniref:glycoside hydrolase family 3 protein n=1 Tax=Streptomyces sp. T028 TaxID=3394379 RepID=UPI003A899F88